MPGLVFRVFLLLIFLQGYNCNAVIRVYNGGRWGIWGNIELCPPGSKAIGYALKVHRVDDEVDNVDDEDYYVEIDSTAVNGVRLYCYSYRTATQSTVSSFEGRFGEWGSNMTCQNNGFLSTFKLRVQPYQGIEDDTAVNNFNFRCNTGEILVGDGLENGNWGPWSNQCFRGICGIQTKVDPTRGVDDNTSLNDARFICC